MATENIIIQQGATFERSISLTDVNNNPLSVDGFTANAAIKQDPDSNTAVAVFEVNLSAGLLTIRMEANTTSTIPSGTYLYDVIMSNGTDVYRPSEGIAEVSPQVATL